MQQAHKGSGLKPFMQFRGSGRVPRTPARMRVWYNVWADVETTSGIRPAHVLPCGGHTSDYCFNATDGADLPYALWIFRLAAAAVDSFLGPLSHFTNLLPFQEHCSSLVNVTHMKKLVPEMYIFSKDTMCRNWQNHALPSPSAASFAFWCIAWQEQLLGHNRSRFFVFHVSDNRSLDLFMFLTRFPCMQHYRVSSAE